MVRPDTVLRSVKAALKESGTLPDSMSYSTFELDAEGGQSNVRPPVIEITTIDTIRSRPHNTSFVGTVTNDQGQDVGRAYEALFEMPIQIDVWTREGDSFDPYEIGQLVRNELYRYDRHMIGDPLPDPDDPSIALGEIDYFTVDDGSVENDLSMTPALRRWRQTAEVWFSEQVQTTESTITTVETPTPGSSEGGTGSVEVVFDVTPNEESAADDYT